MPMAQARFNSALGRALAMAPGTTYLGDGGVPGFFLLCFLRLGTAVPPPVRTAHGLVPAQPPGGGAPGLTLPPLVRGRWNWTPFRRCSNPEVRGQQFSPGLPSHPPPYLPAPPHEWVDYSLLGRLHWPPRAQLPFLLAQPHGRVEFPSWWPGALMPRPPSAPQASLQGWCLSWTPSPCRGAGLHFVGPCICTHWHPCLSL